MGRAFFFLSFIFYFFPWVKIMKKKSYFGRSFQSAGPLQVHAAGGTRSANSTGSRGHSKTFSNARQTVGLLTGRTGESGEICHDGAWLYFAVCSNFWPKPTEGSISPNCRRLRTRIPDFRRRTAGRSFITFISWTRTHDTIKNKTVFICLTLIKRMPRYIKRRGQGPLQIP